MYDVQIYLILSGIGASISSAVSMPVIIHPKNHEGVVRKVVSVYAGHSSNIKLILFFVSFIYYLRFQTEDRDALVAQQVERQAVNL